MSNKVKIDILLDIQYDFDAPTKSIIYTNAKDDVIHELLMAWIQDRIVYDHKKPKDTAYNTKDIYTIKIGLVIENDSFHTESDTGSKDLTMGIIVQVVNLVKDQSIRIEHLNNRADTQKTNSDPLTVP